MGFAASGIQAAADESVPVRMTACTVIPETISRRGTLPETIRVSFSIEKDTPADVARFTATAPAGAFREFTARGTFTKGVTIAGRVLSADPAAPEHRLSPGVECTMTYVHFVDGSSWTAPQ
jgi:hypothetical protein